MAQIGNFRLAVPGEGGYIFFVISSTLDPIRIGTFPGENATPASSQALGQLIQLIELLGKRFGATFEIHSLQSAGAGADGCRAWILGHTLQGAPLLRELPRPSVLEAPWIVPARIIPGTLIWPSEDAQPLRTSTAGAFPDLWVETSSLSKAAIVRAAELADLRARENEQSFVAFVTAGFGEIERFALETVRSTLKGKEVLALPIEEVVSRLPQVGRVPPVLMTLGRLAVPLGRMISIQGWVARAGIPLVGLERTLVQAWGDAGVALTLSPMLDALGLLRENEELVAAIREELRVGTGSNLDPLTQRVLRRLSST